MKKHTQLADLILGSGLVGDSGKRQARAGRTQARTGRRT